MKQEMERAVRILMLEDRQADADLIQYELQETGFAFTAKVVMRERDFVRELREFSPDLILSDYDLPQYNGALALAAAKKHCPDVPFILVTGAISEESAIETLTGGARDYVMKSRLQRLAPAVRRALAEAQEGKARKNAEDARQESERKARQQLTEIQSIYDAAPVGLACLDRELRYVRINQRLADLNGIPAADHIGKTPREIVPDLSPFAEAMAARVFQTGEAVLNAEFSGATNAIPGFKRTWMVHYHPMKDGGGTVIGINVVVEEITERKRLEEELRQSQRSLERRYIAEMTILAEIGRVIGSTLEINEVYERFAAETRKLIPFDSLVVNLRRSPVDTLEVAYASGLDIPGRNVGDSFPTRGAMGEVVMGERRGLIVQSSRGEDMVARFPFLILSVRAGIRSVMSVPLIARDTVIGTLLVRSKQPDAYTEQDLRLAEKIGAQIAGAIANAHLFTNLRGAETSLRENEERFRKIFDDGPLGMITSGRDFRFLRANAAFCRMIGYDEKELTSLSFKEITHPEHVEKDLASVDKLMQGEIPCYQTEKRYVRKDGAIVWGSMTLSVIHNDEGRFLYFLAMIEDITDRKKMEEENRLLQEHLQRAEKMEALGQLAGGVAHDLNNVLGVSTIYAELLREKIPAGNPLRKYADNILTSSGKAAAIIQDLLTLARRGVTVSQVMNVNDVVADFLKTPEIEKIKEFHPQVTFRVKCNRQLLNIKGSPVHLGKTLMNLVSNAAEAISGTGQVVIRTENRYIDTPIEGYDAVKEGEYAILSVSDTGVGIPAENRARVFEPFYTKKAMGRSGTGLGLAIVWGTVKDHNGYIDIQSEVNKGTTFTLYFPVTREEPTETRQTVPVERYMGKGEAIVVVDDSAEQRDVAAKLLSRLGYLVHTISSGEEAVEYLKHHKPALLVLDMIMDPGIDGLETYRRALEIRPNQKAILVSGFSETGRVREAQELGAGAYVKKPYMMGAIGVAIRRELDGPL